MCIETDINECTMGTDDCVDEATCVNTDDSFTCTCSPGFSGNGREGPGGSGCTGMKIAERLSIKLLHCGCFCRMQIDCILWVFLSIMLFLVFMNCMATGDHDLPILSLCV